MSHLAFASHICNLLCILLNRRLAQQAWTPLPKEQAGISEWNLGGNYWESASLVGVRSYYLWVGGHGKVLGKTSQFYCVSHILLNLSCQLSVSHQVGSAVGSVKFGNAPTSWRRTYLWGDRSMGLRKVRRNQGSPCEARSDLLQHRQPHPRPAETASSSIQQPQLHCKHGHLSLECLKQRSKIGAVWCCIVVFLQSLFSNSLQWQVRQDSVRRSFRWSIEEIKARRVADLLHSLFLSEVSSLYWRSLRLAGNLVMSYSLHLPSIRFYFAIFASPGSTGRSLQVECVMIPEHVTDVALRELIAPPRLKALLPKVWCPQRMLRVRTRNV